MATSSNPFIQFIQDGRITCLDDLKRSYRRIVMRTHPDVIGAPDKSDEFVTFSSFYEEAKQFLFNTAKSSIKSISVPETSPRLRFYQKLKKIEFLDMPYAFHRNEHLAEIRSLRADAVKLFEAWNRDNLDLYKVAEKQHQQIWNEKPSGPYLKHALALNIRPVLHNVITFHLTGRPVYKRQARQNIKAIMSRLEEERYNAFKDYLSLLIKDMESGPALFD
jgi:hypothetical protein